MLVLAIWLFCAVIAAVIASNKNRSVVGWLILGAVFGIFAVIFIAVLRPLTANEAAIAARGPRAALVEKTCPKCAETVKAAAQTCRFCGHEFG